MVLQNNLLGVEMLFEKEKPRRCISNNISTSRTLFCDNHENKLFISILPRQQNKAELEQSWSICDVILKQNCCSLLHPRDFRIADDLTWNGNASPKFDFFTVKYEIYNIYHSWHVISTCNWRDSELQIHGFLHIVSKGKMCITSHNPLWHGIIKE